MEGGGWLWLFTMVGVAILGVAMAYGTVQWRKHRKDRAERREMEETVRENYRRGG